MLLYLGSSLFLITVIAFLYFNSVSKSLLESQKDKMRSFASLIASKAISSHMHRLPFEFKNDSSYKIGMYSSKKDLLYGNKIANADFNKDIYTKDDALYLVDRSTQLHMGIKYIVLKDVSIFKKLEELKNRVFFYTIAAMFFISVIGYFLSRLFLRPIANERERLDRFIKDTTHELNTPITALIMSTGLLKGQNDKNIERINLSAKRISNIYKDLCYILKEDINKNNDVIELLDIKEMVSSQVLILEPYAKSKRISIDTDIETFNFNIDKESAERLVNNLITNALKYSKPDSKVSIVLKEGVLKITDQGIGIDQKDLKMITDRYFRANDSEGGFGIGLDIVNKICKRYDIKFTIESQKDVGTKVRVGFNKAL